MQLLEKENLLRWQDMKDNLVKIMQDLYKYKNIGCFLRITS